MDGEASVEVPERSGEQDRARGASEGPVPAELREVEGDAVSWEDSPEAGGSCGAEVGRARLSAGSGILGGTERAGHWLGLCQGGGGG